VLRLFVAAVALAGCYAPSYEDCQFRCASQGMPCPTGMECVAGMCRIEGTTGSCGGGDAGTDATEGTWSAPEDLGLPTGFSDLSITEDGLQLFMSSASQMIYVSTRTNGTFGMPMAIAELNLAPATNPQVSADGLTLYFASSRPPSVGASDIFRATRAMSNALWGTPINVMSLNSTADETGGATTDDSRLLVMTRFVGARAQLFASTLDLSSGAWLGPVEMPNVNMQTANNAHGCFDGSGMRLVFASDRGGDYDIYLATRPSRTVPFGAPVPIDAVNTADDEADPCLSTDGKTLYFARGVVANRKIFRSTYTP
jgi:Tol biopolymer transport system component